MAFDWKNIITPSGVTTSYNEIKQLEAEIGFILPSDYREFLLKYNGGPVVFEHDIPVPALSCDVCVKYLYPVSMDIPFVGVREARHMQIMNKLALRKTIEIGGGYGEGFFYLVLDGHQKGSVQYIFADDLFPEDENVWDNGYIEMMKSMVFICDTFDSLGVKILNNPSLNQI